MCDDNTTCVDSDDDDNTDQCDINIPGCSTAPQIYAHDLFVSCMTASNTTLPRLIHVCCATHHQH